MPFAWKVNLSGFSAEPALPAFCRLALGFAGLDENLVAFCRLESFVGFRFCPGDHRASLKRLKELEHSRFPFSFCSNKRRGDPRVASKRASWASRCESDRGQLRQEWEAITKAASMRVKSRASDADCPEALPVYSVLHVATRCMLSRSRSRSSSLSDSEQDWRRVRTASMIVESSEVRERPSACRSRKKDFADIE